MAAETQIAQESNDGLDLRNLIETIPALVVCTLPDGSVEFANRAWQEYTGIAAEQLSGSGWQTTIHPADAPALIDEWNATLASGRPFATEARLRRSDGQYRWFLIRNALTVNPAQGNESSLRTLIACEDIDDRKWTQARLQQTESELRHERDRLRLLLEITTSMTSKLDLGHVLDALSTNLLSVTRCDFCSLLLPHADSGQLRTTILYNPESRGSICDGTIVPIKGSTCGKAFLTGENHHMDRLEDLRHDPATFGSSEGQRFFERVMAEGLKSGCELPLVGRKGVVGVLGAFSRSEKAFSEDEFAFLDQVSRQVAIAVENALDFEKATEDRVKETKQRIYLEEELRSEFGAIVGDSPALKTALHLVSVVAPTDSSVLILGETGTGKELIARAIHNLSSRRERSFVKLNCAAIPLGLLESELFGHEKGAFTGAIAQKTGRFELANKGTLFLDEVGDIPLELQAKLLRVLQEQEFERLGSNHTHKVDVRLIAATHRDLTSMVKQATFREDLYYRLKVFPINVPALRQRTEDIPKLVWHFTELYARRMTKRIDTILPETMDAFVRYRWPGNVRELQNFIERAVILSPHTVLRAPTSELEPFSAHKSLNMSMTGLEEVERDHIVRALEASNWVVGGRNGAAERLGMKRTSLVYRMRKLRIDRPVSTQQKSAVESRVR